MKYTLIDFAVKMDISPADAYVLPALFDRSSKELNLSRDELIERCMTNQAAAEYMKTVCLQVAKEVA